MLNTLDNETYHISFEAEVYWSFITHLIHDLDCQHQDEHLMPDHHHFWGHDYYPL